MKGSLFRPTIFFVKLKAFNFKIKILPLLKKRFELKELALYKPKINLIKYKNGALNIDDLTRPKKVTPQEKAELEKKKKEEAKKKTDEKKGPEKPFTADDIPVAISIGKIGIEKGMVTYTDEGFNQKFVVYDCSLLAKSIKVDPASLEKSNSMKLEITMGVKTLGKITTGSVKSFDVGFKVDSDVKPFDLKTRKLDPEAFIKLGMPYGSLTGLQIFDKIKSVEQLAKYCGKIDFLKDTVTWKNAFARVWYKAGTLKLEEGTIKTENFDCSYSGKVNINSKATDLVLNMILADKYNKQIRSGLEKNVKKIIKGKAAKLIKPDVIVNEAMKPLVNKEGKVYLGYKVDGTMSKPDVKLVHPKLPSLSDVVKKGASDAGEILKDKATEEANKAVDTAKEEVKKETKKVEDKAKKEATKKTKSAVKKLKF